MRRCSICHTEKPLTNFYQYKRPERNIIKTYYRSACKKCLIEKGRTVYKNSESRRTSVYLNSIWRRYKISALDLMTLLEKQDGKCAICSGTLNRFAIDHEHSTDKVRGIICIPCNTGLGMFYDNPELLRNAALYIERTNA